LISNLWSWWTLWPNVMPLLIGVPRCDDAQNGQAPAVSGRVTAAQITKVAEETGESADWIAGRLRHYAPLFTLTVEWESAVV
jgi:hypothetical protein